MCVRERECVCICCCLLVQCSLLLQLVYGKSERVSVQRESGFCSSIFSFVVSLAAGRPSVSPPPPPPLLLRLRLLFPQTLTHTNSSGSLSFLAHWNCRLLLLLLPPLLCCGPEFLSVCLLSPSQLKCSNSRSRSCARVSLMSRSRRRVEQQQVFDGQSVTMAAGSENMLLFSFTWFSSSVVA